MYIDIIDFKDTWITLVWNGNTTISKKGLTESWWYVGNPTGDSSKFFTHYNVIPLPIFTEWWI